MSEIAEQLELNSTFFYQLVLFAIVFIFLSRVYFRPFLKLIQLRHKRTVEDRKAAEALTQQAQEKMDQYEKRMTEERKKIRAEMELLVTQAKQKESEILSHARDEAKKITQDAMGDMDRQKEALKSKLNAEIETLAAQVSEKLMSRKAP